MAAGRPGDKTISTANDHTARLAQLIAPGKRLVTCSGRLGVVSGLLWLPQAAIVALTIGAFLQPDKQVFPLWLACGGFVFLGSLRALLISRAGKLAFDAAHLSMQAERAALIDREIRRTSQDPARRPAAATATLAAEKLSHLTPFLTRYAPARARVMVLPLVILAIAASMSWAVALILLVSGPLIPVFMALVGKAAKGASERQMEELSDMNVLLLERLVAIVDIRLLDAQQRSVDQFQTAADRLRNRTMEVLRIAFLSSTVLELFAALGVAMVAVYVGLSLLGEVGFGAYGTPITPMQGIFLLLLVPDYFQPLRDLAAAWHDKADADAVAKELVEIESSEVTRFLGLGTDAGGVTGTITTSGVTLNLNGGRHIVFPDVRVGAGQFLAVTGPSGAGKTTFLRLLAGLCAADSGELRMGDTVLDDDTADAWRQNLGWMPQAPRFLTGSLRANLLLAAGNAPRPLEDALALAAAIDVVAALPNGLNTRLGETGIGISGGEARRITLARAAMGRPKVLLADEPTADLDENTARQVMAGLAQLRAEGCTLIIATHDPALIDRADQVVTISTEVLS